MYFITGLPLFPKKKLTELPTSRFIFWIKLLNNLPIFTSNMMAINFMKNNSRIFKQNVFLQFYIINFKIKQNKKI